MTEHDNKDTAMENELRELRQLHDRLPKVEPTSRADDAILRAARNRRPPRPHWPYLVATAASVTAALVAFQVFLIQPPPGEQPRFVSQADAITVRRVETPTEQAKELALPSAPESRARETRPSLPGNVLNSPVPEVEAEEKLEAMHSTENVAKNAQDELREERPRMAAALVANTNDEALDRQIEALATADAETWREQILSLVADDQQALAERLLNAYRQQFPEEPGTSIAELRELATTAKQ